MGALKAAECTVLDASKTGTDDSWMRRTQGLSTAKGTAEDF
jgi:hypothetical protein